MERVAGRVTRRRNGREGKAWEFYDKMFGNREKLLGGGESYIREVTGELGLDYGKLSREIKGGKVKEVMREDGEEGERLGVEGTPYILINDLVIRGAVPYELMREGLRVAREAYE